MAKILTKAGITTGNTVEAFHVTQSIDAFTGIDAYDISLSGSFNMTGSINVSEDLFVGDTVYVGNVTGTPTTNASLYVRQPSITGSSESPIIDIQVDDANSYFRIGNATASDGFFTPSIGTRQSDSPDRLSLFFDALVEDAQDTPGAADVMRFRARRDTPDFIQNRDLYAWYNYTTRLMDMDKDGNLNIVASVTASSYTGSFVGDGSGITSIVSSSYAVTASYALNSPAGTDTNFANTDLTFTADRNHDSNGFDFYVTADNGAFNSAYVGYGFTPTMGGVTTGSYLAVGDSYISITDEVGLGSKTINLVADGTFSIGIDSTQIVLNSSGPATQDVRIAGALNDILFADASTTRIGINKNTPNSTLDVNGDTLISGSLTVNESLTTEASRVKHYREITTTAPVAVPSTEILSTDELLFITQNNSTARLVGSTDGNLQINDFINLTQPGATVECVIVGGTGTQDVVLKYSTMGDPLVINGTAISNQTYPITNSNGTTDTGASFKITNLGNLSASLWGTGLYP